jgi:hypothetical protein
MQQSDLKRLRNVKWYLTADESCEAAQIPVTITTIFFIVNKLYEAKS